MRKLSRDGGRAGRFFITYFRQVQSDPMHRLELEFEASESEDTSRKCKDTSRKVEGISRKLEDISRSLEGTCHKAEDVSRIPEGSPNRLTRRRTAC
jgi:hypothetical protein